MLKKAVRNELPKDQTTADTEIRTSTIHASLGTRADHVIVVVEEPKQMGPMSDEEKHLMLVACSRPRVSLTIILKQMDECRIRAQQYLTTFAANGDVFQCAAGKHSHKKKEQKKRPLSPSAHCKV